MLYVVRRLLLFVVGCRVLFVGCLCDGCLFVACFVLNGDWRVSFVVWLFVGS